MESEKESQEPSVCRKLINEWQARLKAENDRLKEERNARRYKFERDPVEYEAQKEKQREEYRQSKGGTVRAYDKITAKTRDEHAAKAKARDAKRQRDRYAGLFEAERQAISDKIADERWMDRRLKKGVPGDVIQAELLVRLQARDAKRAAKAEEDAAEAELQALPNYGVF